jgi:hypothetical protein
MNQLVAQWIQAACVITLAVLAFLVAQQRDELKSEAVKRGVAEWIVDTEGKTTWKWKESAK